MTKKKTNKAKASANVSEQAAHVAPEVAKAKKGPAVKKNARTSRTNGKGAKPGKKETVGNVAPAQRDGSKKAKVLALLESKEGATLEQMMKATGWQKHSVRGFLSGALGKKMGLTITNAKAESGERVYRLGK